MKLTISDKALINFILGFIDNKMRKTHLFTVLAFYFIAGFGYMSKDYLLQVMIVIL